MVLRYVLAPDSCVYLMSPRLSMWLAGAFIAQRRGRFVAVRLQNSKLIDEVGRRSLRGRVCGLALRRFDRVVCVNAEQVVTATQIGIDPERIRHFPGFLPPSEEEFARSTVSQGVWDFIGRGHRPLIAATGRVAWHGGVDLYGFDMLVDLVARLAPDFPGLSLVVCLWDYRAETDGERIREAPMSGRGVGGRTPHLLQSGAWWLLPVLRAADVMVRPTATDGDANTVREALTLGIPSGGQRCRRAACGNVRCRQIETSLTWSGSCARPSATPKRRSPEAWSWNISTPISRNCPTGRRPPADRPESRPQRSAQVSTPGRVLGCRGCRLGGETAGWRAPGG